MDVAREWQDKERFCIHSYFIRRASQLITATRINLCLAVKVTV